MMDNLISSPVNPQSANPSTSTPNSQNEALEALQDLLNAGVPSHTLKFECHKCHEKFRLIEDKEEAVMHVNDCDGIKKNEAVMNEKRLQKTTKRMKENELLKDKSTNWLYVLK